jgi:hypothetical protein
LDRYRALVRDLPATAARDPVAGREALREVLCGSSITIRPGAGGAIKAVVPVPPIYKLLNQVGSGGRI